MLTHDVGTAESLEVVGLGCLFFNALFAAGLDYDDTITVTSDHIFSDSSSPKNCLERKCSEKTEQKASISLYTLISTLSALIFHILTKFLALDFR